VTRLMDVGGGTGAFLAAAGARHPSLDLVLFDLPAVVGPARARFAAAGMAGRITILPGSFRDDPIPPGADAISLVRVLYDHADEAVAALLAAVHAALPKGGRLIISEPMSGGDRPDAITDTFTNSRNARTKSLLHAGDGHGADSLCRASCRSGERGGIRPGDGPARTPVLHHRSGPGAEMTPALADVHFGLHIAVNLR